MKRSKRRSTKNQKDIYFSKCLFGLVFGGISISISISNINNHNKRIFQISTFKFKCELRLIPHKQMLHIDDDEFSCYTVCCYINNFFSLSGSELNKLVQWLILCDGLSGVHYMSHNKSTSNKRNSCCTLFCAMTLVSWLIMVSWLIIIVIRPEFTYHTDQRILLKKYEKGFLSMTGQKKRFSSRCGSTKPQSYFSQFNTL